MKSLLLDWSPAYLKQKGNDHDLNGIGRAGYD